MTDTYRPGVASGARARDGLPVDRTVAAEAVTRMIGGEKPADTRRWLWQEHQVTVTPPTLTRWRQTVREGRRL